MSQKGLCPLNPAATLPLQQAHGGIMVSTDIATISWPLSVLLYNVLHILFHSLSLSHTSEHIMSQL